MKVLSLALFIMLSILSSYTQHAYAGKESDEILERQVKSAYIFKFGNYITWPDNVFTDATSPIIIGVVEDDSVAGELERVAAAGNLTGNRPVVIKKLQANDMSIDVHILYVSSNADKIISAYQNTHLQSATLYITNVEKGLSTGSVINFVQDNNRLRFDVSLPAAEHNKIKLDASLLTVARQVINTN